MFGAGVGASESDETDSTETDALRPFEAKKSPLTAPKTEEESVSGATYFTKYVLTLVPGYKVIVRIPYLCGPYKLCL